MTTAAKTRRQSATLKLTSTAIPTVKTDSRRTVYGNTDECLHRWAANDKAQGRSGSVYFLGGCLLSYTTVVGRHVRGRDGTRFVLLTTRRYSVTTSGHMSGAAAAVRGQAVFHVDDVTADTVAEHRANLTKMAETAAALQAKAKRARTNAGGYLSSAAALIRNANAYAETVGLAERLTTDLAALDAEAAARKAKDDADRTAAQKKREKERKAKAAKAVAEWEQRVAAWKDGGQLPGYCPDPSHPLAGYAWLRMRAKNTIIETSMGVSVPLAAALPLLELIRSGHDYYRTRPSETRPSLNNPLPMPEMKIDGFQPSHIDQKNGVVVVGCHTLSIMDILELADRLGV